MEKTVKIDLDMLELLRCPITGSKLMLEGNKLIAQGFGISYPVIDGVPVLLRERANPPQGFKTLSEFLETLSAPHKKD